VSLIEPAKIAIVFITQLGNMKYAGGGGAVLVRVYSLRAT